MTVTPEPFELTAEQRQFKRILGQYPRLEPYWDFEKRECDIDGLRDAINAMSHGEAIMARFLSAVWSGKDTLDFDLIDAVKSLDDDHLKVISDWLSKPLFP